MKNGGGARGFITVKGEIKKLKNEIYVWKSWRNLSTGRANPPTAICCSVASLHRSPNDFTSDFLSVSLCSFFAFKTMISSFGRNDYHNIKKIAFLFNEFYSSGMQWRKQINLLERRLRTYAASMRWRRHRFMVHHTLQDQLRRISLRILWWKPEQMVKQTAQREPCIITCSNHVLMNISSTTRKKLV